MSATQSLFHSRTLKKSLAISSPLKDGEIPAKAKATLKEQQLNQAVYKLFGLDGNEIKSLEDSLR